MQSKLTKAMVFGTDLQKAVDTIISPDAPMALRLTSNLLLGVVRILHRKTKYLLQESSDAVTRLRLTFRPTTQTSVDLPPTNPTANFNAVTLGEASVDDLAAPLVDLSLVPPGPTTRPASSAFLAADRDITIDDYAGGLAGGMLDAFALEPELDRDAAANLDLADLDHEPLLFTPSQRPSQQDNTPLTPSVRSNPPSIEVLRAASVNEAERRGRDAPQLSLEKDPLPSVENPRTGDGTPALPGASALSPVELPSALEESPEAAVAAIGAKGEGEPGLVGEDGGDSPSGDRGASGGALGRISTGGDDLALTDDADDTPANVPGAGDGQIGGQDELELDEGDVPLGGLRREDEPTQTQDGATQELTEGPAEAEDKMDDNNATEALTGRGRKRKHTLIEDRTTELSTRDFRAFLSDTSDLLRPPRSRRRAGVGRLYQGRRVPLRYEELISRPTVPLAPQLSELFTLAFQMDDAPEQVGSPMSDADLANANRAVQEGEAREDEAELEISPAKSALPATPEKATGKQSVPEDEARKAQEEHEDVLADGSQLMKNAKEAATPQRPEKPVVADIFPLSPVPEMEEGLFEPEGRRSSFGIGSNAPPDDAAELMMEVSSSITLKDVALTRSQVEQDQDSDDNEVTETTISARTHKMQEYILEHLDEDTGELNFSHALRSEAEVNRRIAARSFYELLNLSSKKALQMSQDSAYGTIRARPIQPAFSMLARSE